MRTLQFSGRCVLQSLPISATSHTTQHTTWNRKRASPLPAPPASRAARTAPALFSPDRAPFCAGAALPPPFSVQLPPSRAPSWPHCALLTLLVIPTSPTTPRVFDAYLSQHHPSPSLPGPARSSQHRPLPSFPLPPHWLRPRQTVPASARFEPGFPPRLHGSRYLALSDALPRHSEHVTAHARALPAISLYSADHFERKEKHKRFDPRCRHTSCAFCLCTT